MKHCISQQRPQSRSQHRGPGGIQVWSKLWGPQWGYYPQGWWQIRDPPATRAPDTAQGGCPLPQRHRKLTPEKHTDQRKDGGNCWAVTWQRRWSSTSRARVQAGTQPTLPAVEPLELTDPKQPMPTTTYVYRPHLTASPATKFKPQSKLEFTQAGPQGLEGPAPHNHPELSDARGPVRLQRILGQGFWWGRPRAWALRCHVSQDEGKPAPLAPGRRTDRHR